MGFKNAWGAYKVDSLDYKTLSVVLPDNSSIYSKMEAAAIKAFVNSDGEMTEYAFDGNTNTVYSGEEIIFDGSELEEEPAPNEIIEPSEEDTKKEETSTDIIGGADGPTSIFVLGRPIKDIIALIVIYTLMVLGIGYGIGYSVKSKK